MTNCAKQKKTARHLNSASVNNTTVANVCLNVPLLQFILYGRDLHGTDFNTK